MASLGFSPADAVHAHRIFTGMIIGFVMQFEVAAQSAGRPPASQPFVDTFEMLTNLLAASFTSADWRELTSPAAT